MGFASGSISFRRYAVVGQSPEAIDESVLERLAEHALRERDLGVPEDEEYGWSGGRHVLDGNFSFESNVYADALCFALRIDVNKVPGDLKKAYTIMEEDAAAAGNPSGFVSKLQKREARDVVRRKLDDDLRSGRFRRSKLVPILWDVPSATLYASASGSSEEKLLEIFERTFELKLAPLSSGSLALRLLEPTGKRRDYEDLRPTRFVQGPEGEGQYPEYPWVAKGPEPKDFLGNEFLTWLWHEAEARQAAIETADAGDVAVFFDKALDLDCAYGQSGRDALRGDGVTRMPEALDALRSGKVPRKAGLMLEASGQQYNLTFGAESFFAGSLRLPEVEEADNPRVLFEERVAMLRDFGRTLDALYATFLCTRASSGWEGHTTTIRRWIMQSTRATAPSVSVSIARSAGGLQPA
jgi:hypothetical protein